MLAQNQFVQVDGTQFLIGGKPYYFLGTNYWYGPLLGANAQGRERLIQELDHLQSIGINNLRVLVGAEKSDSSSVIQPALQTRPGEYNESLFNGLDFLLAEMAKRDMYAVLYLNNNWIWSGGMSQYLNWFGYGDVPDPFSEEHDWPDYMAYSQQFYSCKACVDAYHQHVKTVISRTNQVTGIPYNLDPTIMSWQLANEPRVFNVENQEAFNKWVNDSVELIETLAPYQLISTGSEGEAGSTMSLKLFEQNHQNNNIDYLTMHVWPKNWSWYDAFSENPDIEAALEKTFTYMDKHLAVAKRLNKPIVMSEFGFPREKESLASMSSVAQRDAYFLKIFDRLVKEADSSGALAGLNFWAYGGFGKANIENKGKWQPGDDYVGDPAQEPQGLNTVFASDSSTLELINQTTQKLSKH
ncbi:hypothetical protein E8M12_14755 [Thalassotalea mangrovi]|uniref:mannan endo-1,4-beta-mannosidase n=2 Tax=Thalassotalea mangrovi TaxID=2572245 RepID=A0A4U1B267_9GAMM|nr:hypothetical protein E8M12_14755 [Thalassotalea mangrovi]